MVKIFFVSGLIIISSVFASAQTDIHKVDFKNFTYLPFCVGSKPQRVTVRDGEFSKETQMDGYVDRFYFNVFDVAFGDLNADGADEAVVLTSCNTGGTGNFSEGFVYAMKAGKPSLTARIPGGDRAYGGLRSAAISGGVLTIDANDVGELGGACCPEFAVATKYKLAAGKLIKFARPVRRELYPKERMTFARGASEKTFTVRVDAQDIKRYVLGARAGQILSVSVSTPKVSLRLLEDAAVTEGENGFNARLPKNSDYSFELQNISESAVDVTVTVKIK